MTTDYQQYINSKQWKARRNAYIRKNKYCEECKHNGIKTIAQDVHHVTYRHKGSERDYELAALCRQCHAYVHYKGKAKIKRKWIKPLILSILLIGYALNAEYINKTIRLISINVRDIFAAITQ